MKLIVQSFFLFAESSLILFFWFCAAGGHCIVPYDILKHCDEKERAFVRVIYINQTHSDDIKSRFLSLKNADVVAVRFICPVLVV